MSFRTLETIHARTIGIGTASFSASSGQTPDAGLQPPAGLAHAAGLPKKGIQTKRAAALMAANFTETQSFQRDHLLNCSMI
jgi:hypothetical protein